MASSALGQSGGIDDVSYAVRGMTLLLNNEWKEAEELFSQFSNYSALMSAGDCMTKFMQSLMTFEEEQLADALKTFQALEKRCDSSSSFQKSAQCKLNKKSNGAAYIEDKLQRQIIAADALLFQAMLAFINQDISGYVKGGWLLRKAWKLYEKLHKDISGIHQQVSSGCDRVKVNGVGSSINDGMEAGVGMANGKDAGMKNVASSASLTSLGDISIEVVDRLLGSVSFGFGAFQLAISLVPPKILKIIEFLGFEGDRAAGLEALRVCSGSADPKAPLGSLSLVWYHTVIRPFFALDGPDLCAGVGAAKAELEKAQEAYPKSALFLFFTGRIHRLQRDVDAALTSYSVALEASASQRETRLICQHEIGWLHLLMLDWPKAFQCFQELQEESRWSKSYYAYLSACCQGASGDITAAQETLKQVPGLVKRKNNQIEQFVLKRADRFKKNAPSMEYLTLLLLEVIYLWNAIPTCKKEDLQKMLDECNKQSDKKVFHLRSLIEGAIYRETDMTEMAMQCFEEAVARHEGMKTECHVPAYANYEMGTLYAASAETLEKGTKLLTKAKEQYKEFDFDNRLHVRVNAALKRIKLEGTPL